MLLRDTFRSQDGRPLGNQGVSWVVYKRDKRDSSGCIRCWAGEESPVYGNGYEKKTGWRVTRRAEAKNGGLHDAQMSLSAVTSGHICHGARARDS